MLWVALFSGDGFGREAGAVDMLGSPLVSVEEMHHVEAGPHHEDHKQEISNQY
jgi:hypothetical protein